MLNQDKAKENQIQKKKNLALNKQTHYDNQAWHEVQSINDINVPKPNTSNPILAIQLDDPYILRHASEGDRITFILPNYEAVIVEVQEVSYPAENITQWTGKLENKYGGYPVNITMDENSTIGRIVTPKGGTYSIKLEHGRGWIYQAESSQFHQDVIDK